LIVDALVLATATGTGAWLIYNQLPLSMKNWLMNHRLFTRIICALGTYTLLGGTLTALFSAAFLDIMVGTLLNIMADQNAAESLRRLGQYLSSLRQKIVDFLAGACKSLPKIAPALRQPVQTQSVAQA
jgi:hypothetical protein